MDTIPVGITVRSLPVLSLARLHQWKCQPDAKDIETAGSLQAVVPGPARYRNNLSLQIAMSALFWLPDHLAPDLLDEAGCRGRDAHTDHLADGLLACQAGQHACREISPGGSITRVKNTESLAR